MTSRPHSPQVTPLTPTSGVEWCGDDVTFPRNFVGGRAFYLGAILGGEVEGVLDKVTLIPGHLPATPTKTGRESDLGTRC